MSIYEEKQPKLWVALLILTVCFICSFPLWKFGAEQLTSNEGQYATAVSELHHMQTYTTLHAQASYEIMPLYPFMVKCFYKCGVSMEFALRFVAFLSLALLALMTGLVSGRTYDRQTGIVATLAVFSSYLVLYHATDGFPHTTIALFLYCGWMCWFYLGYMRSYWDIALVSIGVFSVLIFFLGGKFSMFCFLLPIAFLHRPFKVWTHVRNKCFLIALSLIFIGMLLWLIPIQNTLADYTVDSSEKIKISSILFHLFIFPFEALFELFPWSFFIWMPFCPLLIPIEEKPLFMKYHRNLFIVLAILLWCNPGVEVREVIYLIPLFATLVASYYRIFVRRYSVQCFHVATICAIFSIAWIFFLFLQIIFPSNSLIATFITPLSHVIWHFTPYEDTSLKFVYVGIGFLSVFLSVSAIYLAYRKFCPWILWCVLFLSFAIPYHEIVIPEKSGLREKFVLGHEIRSIIDKQQQDAHCLYKDSAITGLYAECFYIGLPVVVTRQGKLPSSVPDTIFMLTTGTPSLYTEKSWTLLLSKIYRDKSLYLYKGDSIPDEETIK